MSRIAPIPFLLACVGFVQTTFVKVKVTSAPSEPPEACTYYLSPAGSDTNSGTIQAPWKHLQKAFDTLTAGQVVCLRTGTYEPAGAYNTPSYRHTISRSGGLVFQGPLGPDASGVKGKGAGQVWLDRCHNVVLDHVEIRKNDYHAGLYASEVSDVQVLGCYVHDNGRFDVDTDTMGQHPINVDQGIYWAASGGTNRIANCLLEHNRSANLQLFAGSGKITGLTIVENTIVKAMNSGVIIGKGADGNTFANNIVFMNSQQTNNGQIRLADDASNNIIDTNISWGRTTTSERVDTSTLTGSGNVVRNLMVSDPRFVDFPGGNYHLRPGSPAINVSLSVGSDSADMDGMRRPSRTSLGAYEYKPSP